MILQKSTACGYTSFLSMLPLEPSFQFLQILAYIDKSAINWDHSILIGQVSLVNTSKVSVCKTDELKHVLVFGDRLSDIIDLSACITSCVIREEKNRIDVENLWRDVDKLPIWGLPDAMKLRFEKYPSPDMDTPTKLLFAAESKNMLWHDGETFVDWLRSNGAKWNHDRLF